MNIIFDWFRQHWAISIYPVSTAFGVVVGWVGAMRKVQGEIAKLRAEVVKLQQEAVSEAGITLERIQIRRKDFTQSCASCSACVRAVIAILQSAKPDKNQTKDAREKLCSVVGEETIPAFHNLVEFEHLSRKSDPQLLKNFIESQVIPELQRFANWLRVINGDKFIREYGLSPLTFSIQTAQPFLDVLAGLSPAEKANLEPVIVAVIAQMRGA